MPTTEEIREKSLHELLYNESNGKRKPLSTDIKQGGINDCYLLANLIDLAKTKPDFIMNELITTEGQDPNIVKVNFYENGPINIKINFDKEKLNMDFMANKSKKHTFTVTKQEAMNWSAQHKAFWPIVVEIAYAKFSKIFKRGKLVKRLVDNINEMYVLASYSPKEPLIRRIPATAEKIISTASKTSLPPEFEEKLSKNALSYEKELKNEINEISISNLAYTHLTGMPSKKHSQNLYMNDKKGIKPFTTNYSDDALKLYKKIQQNLQSNHFVCATFNTVFVHTTALDAERSAELACDPKNFEDLNLSEDFKDKFQQFINSKILEDLGLPPSYKIIRGADQHRFYRFDSLPEKERKQLLTEFFTINLPNMKESSKRHIGILGGHSYTVLDCMEHDGYKYIIIANPHGTTTKIDYAAKLERMKKKGTLPKTVTTPQQIDNANGECAMELNDFYKKLASIDYAYNPEEVARKREEKAYEALRDMFK